MSIPPKNYPESFDNPVFVNFIKTHVNQIDFEYHKNHLEICLVTSGKFCYVFGGRRYDLSPYDMLLIPADTNHKLVSFETSSNPRAIIVNFKEEVIEKSTGDTMILLDIFKNPKFSIPSNYIPAIDSIFNKMVFESDYPSLFSMDLLKQYVYELLVSLYRFTNNLKLPDNMPTKKVVEGALKFIAENYNRNITLADVSDFCHVDKHYLSRTFKETMGIGINAYINTIRTHEASAMLIETNKSILEISEACGFNTVKHFCDVFKKAKGMNATEFRKNRMS